MRATFGLIAVAVLMSGCAASGHHPRGSSSVGPDSASTTASLGASAPAAQQCPAQLRVTFAQAAKSPAVSAHADTSAGYVVCTYGAHATAAGGCTGASVSINDQAQAYWDFQRWVVESGQTAGQSHQPGLAPVQVNAGIGIEADWIAAKLNFEAARADRWVAVFLTCPAQSPRQLALAEDLARVAMDS